MSKFVLHIVFLFTLFFVQGQPNLVPNGSFEEYNWCPSTADGYYLNACKYWDSPTLGTPDYFNACSNEYDSSLQSYLYSVPENYYGNQTAHSGNGYGAFVFTQDHIGSQTYSEYLQIKLNQQLTKGKFYQIQFFIHNPRSNYCINSVGALLTPSELNLNTEEIILIKPQVCSDTSIFFCDTNNWYQVNGIFCAKGDENYLIIGLFDQLPALKVVDYNGLPIFGAFATYLYIDDVSVIETEIDLANIFTPNNDGINDVYYLDLRQIGAKKAEIYNRWGNLITEGETSISWDGTFNGVICSEGVYFLQIQFENNIVNGFIHLFK